MLVDSASRDLQYRRVWHGSVAHNCRRVVIANPGCGEAVPLEVLKVHTCTELLVAPAGEQIRSQVVVVALRVQQHTCLARPFSGLSGTRPSLAATQSIKCIVLPIRGVAISWRRQGSNWIYLPRPANSSAKRQRAGKLHLVGFRCRQPPPRAQA